MKKFFLALLAVTSLILLSSCEQPKPKSGWGKYEPDPIDSIVFNGSFTSEQEMYFYPSKTELIAQYTLAVKESYRNCPSSFDANKYLTKHTFESYRDVVCLSNSTHNTVETITPAELKQMLIQYKAEYPDVCFAYASLSYGTTYITIYFVENDKLMCSYYDSFEHGFN